MTPDQATDVRSDDMTSDQELYPGTERDDASGVDLDRDGSFGGELSAPGDDVADRDIIVVAAADNLAVDGPDDDLDDEPEDDGLEPADEDDAVADRHDMPLATARYNGPLDASAHDGASGAAERDMAPAAARHDNGDIGREWHDIQAMFVDDPRGSVQLAAAAADAAVGALVATLHERQSALAPGASAQDDSGETEQLREALRSYRIFCQNVADLGHQVNEPVTTGR